MAKQPTKNPLEDLFPFELMAWAVQFPQTISTKVSSLCRLRVYPFYLGILPINHQHSSDTSAFRNFLRRDLSEADLGTG